MSDTTTTIPAGRPDPAADPHAYVREAVWPPLPAAFGTWLADLTHRALDGADPDLELAVPGAVLDTGIHIPLSRKADDGTIVTTLGRALTLFGAEHLLFPEADASDEPVEIFEPVVALTLASTADAATVDATYHPDTVKMLAARLTGGEWNYRLATVIRVDRHGRVTHGLNTLLAIVEANLPAPAIAHYADELSEDGPLTWRGPADDTEEEPHDR